MGYKTRSGEYTRSRYFATLAHKNPRVTGCSGSPWIFVARPSSTVISTPQASGQSCGQAAWTTCFIDLRLYGASSRTSRQVATRQKTDGLEAVRQFTARGINCLAQAQTPAPRKPWDPT